MFAIAITGLIGLFGLLFLMFAIFWTQHNAYQVHLSRMEYLIESLTLRSMCKTGQEAALVHDLFQASKGRNQPTTVYHPSPTPEESLGEPYPFDTTAGPIQNEAGETLEEI